MSRAAELAGAAVLAAVGVCGLATGLGYGVGEVTEPGPGLMPVLTGLALVILAGLIAGTEIIGRPADVPVPGEADIPIASDALRRLVGYVGGIFAFALLMDPIGTLPTVVLFFVWIVRGVERQSWRLTLALTAGTTLTVWLLFVKALGVELPMGTW